jgi:hypothetical protein
MQAAEKKRVKEEKDIVHRLRPFARLQTAEDYEIFAADILCKSNWSIAAIVTVHVYHLRRSHSPKKDTGPAALSSNGPYNGS